MPVAAVPTGRACLARQVSAEQLQGAEQAETTALELLDRVEMRDKARAYLDALSGGQQHRVAIYQVSDRCRAQRAVGPGVSQTRRVGS